MDTEKMPWFAAVQPYIEIALPWNITEAVAPGVFVRLQREG